MGNLLRKLQRYVEEGLTLMRQINDGIGRIERKLDRIEEHAARIDQKMGREPFVRPPLNGRQPNP